MIRIIFDGMIETFFTYANLNSGYLTGYVTWRGWPLACGLTAAKHAFSLLQPHDKAFYAKKT